MNMKKIASKIGALGMAAVMLAAMSVPAAAAFTYEPVAGTGTTFNTYLIMDAGDTVPNVTFSYTVAPGTAIAGGTDSETGVTTFPVLAGVGTPTIAPVTFAPGDTTAASAAGSNVDIVRSNEARTGTRGDDFVQLGSGEKFAVKEAAIDFSGVSFSEPGVYRYIITETADAGHAAAGIVHDTDVDRVLDVYVTDNNGLVVSAYVLHTNADPIEANEGHGSGDVDTAGKLLPDKTDGFTNEVNYKDLAFKKEVSGNQASRDKYFEFTVTLADVNDADSFVVSLADDGDAYTNDGNADATSGTNSATIAANAGKTNPSTVTGAQLKAGQKFYLQHGQSVVIRGIPLNATYAVTENAEDYKSTGSAVTDYKAATTGVIGTVAGAEKIAKTSYKNERNGIIPTGAAMAVGSMVVVLGVGGLGIAVMALKKRKREED